MGVGYDGKPNDYQYGKFDYTLWTAGSEVTLVNVPWDSVFVSAVEFPNGQAGLDAYLDSRPNHMFTAMQNMYPFDDLRVPFTHSDASRFNYVRVRNSDVPVQGGKPVKTYYYFIDEAYPLSPEVTGLRLTVDIWQTYIYDVKFGNCYVNRSHLGIAASNNFDSFGRKYLTVPEGIDLGSDYQTIVKQTRQIMSGRSDAPLTTKANVLVVSTTDLLAEPGTVNNPTLITAGGTRWQNQSSGATYYMFKSIQSFTDWLRTHNDISWVTQGITAAYMVPPLERYGANPVIPYEPFPIQDTNILSAILPRKNNLAPNWRASANIANNIPEKYRHLKKFYTFPYMAIELTTWTGTPIILKPEIWNNPDAMIIERVSYIAPGQRVEMYAQGYNSPDGYKPDNYNKMTDAQIDALDIPEQLKTDLKNVGDDSGDYLDHATKIANFPSMAVLNNAANVALASMAHTLAYSRDSAEWSQYRATMGAQTAFGNTMRGTELNTELTGISNSAANRQTANANRASRAITASNVEAANWMMGGNLVGNLLSGNVGAGLSGIYNTGVSNANATANNAIEMGARTESTAISNSAARASTRAGNATTQDIAGRNLQLANFAADGDYQNAIAAINAQVKDTALMPPNVHGQVGGETMNLAHDTVEISCRWKMVDQATIKRIGDYWLRYGYAMNMFYRLDRLSVMTKFTYWKLLETYIVEGDIPEMFKQALRGIMQKGVTVYRNPDDIGNIDIADNQPIGGITL